MLRIFNQYVSAKVVGLAVLESLLIGLAVFGAARLRFWNDPWELHLYTGWPDFAWQVAAVLLVLQASLYYNDLYDFRTVRAPGEQLARLGQSLGAATLLLSLAYFFLPALLPGRGVFSLSMLLVLLLLGLDRCVLERLWSGPPRRIFILGEGPLARQVEREMGQRPDLNLQLRGVSAPADLAGLAGRQRIDRIILALEDRRGILPVQDLVRLRVSGVEVEEAHTTLAALTGRVPLESVPPSWFIFNAGFRRSRLNLAAKRALDLLLAASGLLLAAPLLVVLACAIRLDSPGPALYRQERVGWRGRRFRLLKFRSMRTGAESDGRAQWARAADPRVTRLGRLLRRYRLDELPQFFNILRGEMSFVGPRPERPEFVEELRRQIPYYDERHSVRPGLTGWAQVRYPYGASVEDARRKLEYDLFYLQNLSVCFDCAIVLRTLRVVGWGQGAR